jgi:hypothetical protein
MEYTAKKSPGQDKYLFDDEVEPVTLLRSEGNCTVL